ncbi:MAG: nucleotide exchange factor GrpE [Caulobacterales bacterium]|jgi:molecular chaperone GrpE
MQDQPEQPSELESPIPVQPAEVRIAQLEAELAEAKDQMLRALAESQNAQRRAEKQAQEARIYAVDRFAGDLVSVADTLSRAIETTPAEAREQDTTRTLLIGVEMTEKALLDVFAKHGLRRVGAKGEAFDPNRHQAVAQIPSDSPTGTVAEVFQPGYVLHDRTLRAAMVAVSLGGQSTAPPPAGDGEPGSQVDVSA